MPPEVERYLQEVTRRLKLEPVQVGEILHELESHLEDEAQALQEQGLGRQAALSRSLERLGHPEGLARQYQAVHSPSSWPETSASVLPHLLFAVLFALHLWTTTIWVALLFITATVVSVTAWRRGQAKWTYPWLGYCLVAPVFGWSLALRAVSTGAWSLLTGRALSLALPVYFGLFLYLLIVLWAVSSVLMRVIRRDWLHASVAALPFPFLLAWLFYINEHGGLLAPYGRRLGEVDGATALVFLGLAVTTVAVYRLGTRTLRIAVLGLATPLLILVANLAYHGDALSGSVFLLLVLGIGILALPAYLDTRQSRREEGRAT